MLKSYVRYFWTLEEDSKSADKTIFKTLVDDSSGFILQHHNGQSAFTDDRGNDLPVSFFYGQSTRPTTTYTKSPFQLVGVHFHPHAIKTLFHTDADRLTDQKDDGEILGKYPLGRPLLNSSSQKERLSLLQELLLERVQNSARHDHLVCLSLRMIHKKKGKIHLQELLQLDDISERQFERRFKATVGIPPKLYIRITRFREAVRLMKEKQFVRLSDIAFELNYADQAHFIRDIREFSGYTPGSISEQVTEFILNLHTTER